MSVGCLEGVWEVSVGCLSDSGYCLGRYDVQAIDNNPIRFIYITVFLFSQLPRIGQNVPYFGVSVGEDFKYYFADFVRKGCLLYTSSEPTRP